MQSSRLCTDNKSLTHPPPLGLHNGCVRGVFLKLNYITDVLFIKHTFTKQKLKRLGGDIRLGLLP